jgi:hypothetical protein
MFGNSRVATYYLGHGLILLAMIRKFRYRNQNSLMMEDIYLNGKEVYGLDPSGTVTPQHTRIAQ